jgi:leucyl-tRNA synthetase
LEEKKIGQRKTQYKLRDWLVSRQRYWGAPIPIVYCEQCGEVLVEENELPVLLPDDVDFKPTGESPLTSSESFHTSVKCPKCGATEGVRREVDTMDTFVCSSWYFLRYPDSHNSEAPFDQEKINKWLPVDLYVGGAEHAVLHLLYARFFTKALADMGYLDFREPFTKLRNQGMILAEDGRKMSKSLCNVVNPDEVVIDFGADTFRLYEMFMGPLEDSKPWNTNSIAGVRRFLEKVWNLQNIVGDESTVEVKKILHQTIKKVTQDIEDIKYNTAISQMMILVNTVEKNKNISQEDLGVFIKLLNPFAPHITEEMWQQLKGDGQLVNSTWPECDEDLARESEIEIAVQVSGKIRDKLQVAVDTEEEEIKKMALASEKVQTWVDGKEIKKVIYVKGKLVSVVVQ